MIGDVEGHNLIAASLMGRLRTTVHAYAREGHGPAEVMARANQWLVELNANDPNLALFATCCFVVVNPATRELAICRAGHSPAILVPPDCGLTDRNRETRLTTKEYIKPVKYRDIALPRLTSGRTS